MASEFGTTREILLELREEVVKLKEIISERQTVEVNVNSGGMTIPAEFFEAILPEYTVQYSLPGSGYAPQSWITIMRQGDELLLTFNLGNSQITRKLQKGPALYPTTIRQ